MIGERLGAGDLSLDAIFVRRGEDFFGGHVGNAVAAVLRGGASAEPEVIVGKADAKIGAGSAEVQGRIALLVQAGGARVQVGVMLLPGGYGIGTVGARGGEDGVPQAGLGFVGRQIGEYGRGPGGSGVGDDGPIDLVAHDQFEGRAVGLGVGAIGAAHFFRVFAREQAGIAAGDRQARGAVAECLRHAFVEPGRGGVKAGVGAVAEAEQRRFLVGIEHGDEGSARFVGMLGDAARQRNGVERGGHDQLLAGRESESAVDGDFGQAVEILLEFGRLVVLSFGECCGCVHRRCVMAAIIAPRPNALTICRAETLPTGQQGLRQKPERGGENPSVLQTAPRTPIPGAVSPRSTPTEKIYPDRSLRGRLCLSLASAGLLDHSKYWTSEVPQCGTWFAHSRSERFMRGKRGYGNRLRFRNGGGP